MLLVNNREFNCLKRKVVSQSSNQRVGDLVVQLVRPSA